MAIIMPHTLRFQTLLIRNILSMNQIHLHLLVNHIPILLIPLGGLLLALGLWKQNALVRQIGLWISLFALAGGWVAHFSGEQAEEIIEGYSWAKEKLIHQHEEAAESAHAGIIVLSVLTLLGLLYGEKKSNWARIIYPTLVLVSLVTSILAAYAGYEGGKIRHDEIHTGTTPPSLEVGPSESHSDD